MPGKKSGKGDSTAKDYLIAYGYVLSEDGKYRRPGRRTQVWEPTEGGFLRYDDNGREEEPEVWKVSEAFEGTAGLDKVRHPQSFDWVWPDEEVARIYKAAVEAVGQ